MSVYVQNLNTGEVIDSYREEHVVPPASVMKLLTTGAALEIMGPGFRFPTILEYTGSIQNGVSSTFLQERSSSVFRRGNAC